MFQENLFPNNSSGNFGNFQELLFPKFGTSGGVTIPIIQQNVDEVEFIINYISQNIAQYDLKELTNGNMGDIPNIIGAHPLAMEYGNLLSADEEGNYTSILPAIGVELIDDNDNSTQYLGSGYKVYEIDQNWIDEINSINLKNRFKEGIVLSDSNLTLIQNAKTAKGSEKLWTKSSKYQMNQNVNVSCWSDNWQVTRILYVVVRSLLHEIKHELSKNGVKNASLSGQGAIYNYEFNQTLFGSEFNLKFINSHRDSKIDSSILTTAKVDESILGEDGKSKPTFKGTN